MKYNSIGEYFYRLSNRCLGLVLLPVLVVLGAYVSNQYFLTGLPWLGADETLMVRLLWAETVITLLFIALQLGMASSKLKALRPEPSLGKRITGYVPVVMARFRIFSLMLLTIGLNVFLTGELAFLFFLPFPVIFILAYWPFRIRMAKDLRLKHEESEILKNKKLGV